MKKRSLVCKFLFLALSFSLFAAEPQLKPSDTLKKKLESLVSSFDGKVGVALLCGEENLCINSTEPFPMFSFMKFPQALAVCDALKSKNLSIETSVEVKKNELRKNTWSPLQKSYPNGGKFPVSTLLEYTLQESDNNACDILFDRFASPSQVNDYVKKIGIKNINIQWNEEQQHKKIKRAYENCATPLAAAQLMGWFYDNCTADDNFNFVWNTMAKCKTGQNRIPKYISNFDVEIIHKTGTGAPLPDGTFMGICDVANIVFPDGNHFELAVMIKDTHCRLQECEELIAVIANLIYQDLISAEMN